jgi:hypothetical protein
MKKLMTILLGTFIFVSCGSDSNNAGETDITRADGDSAGLTNPIAIDTVKHPAGMSNQNVISTDTAAMNVQNSINKAKEAEKKH